MITRRLIFIVGAIVLIAGPVSARADEVWQVAQYPASGPPRVVIRHHPYDAREVPRLVRLVEEGRQRFDALADTTMPTTITVLAASTRLEFSRLTEGVLPDWGAAVAFPDERLIIVSIDASGTNTLEEAIPHEVSHVLLGAVAADQVPRWFDEGLAMEIAGEWDIYNSFRLARGALVGLIPLADVDGVLSFQQDRAWLAYAESFGAVSWLRETAGEPGLGEVIRDLTTMPFDEALTAVTGMDARQFEAAWLRRTRARYVLVGLADDMWLWSIVIPTLFFLALGLRWWRNRRTMLQWQREGDGDDDDDDDDEQLDEHIADTYG